MYERGSRRFSLADILVGLTVLSVFCAIILPQLARSHGQSRQYACSNNLKQIGLALHSYHDTFNVMPPNGLYLRTARGSNNPYTWDDTARGSVFVKLMPYLELNPAYDHLNFVMAGKKDAFLDQNVGGEKLRDLVVPALLCPEPRFSPNLDGQAAGAVSCYSPSIGSQRMDSRSNWCVDYPGNLFGTGPANHAVDFRGFRVSGVFARGHWAAKFRDMVDGQSQVILCGEILPNKGDHHSLGWTHHHALWTATVAPLNYPIRGIGEKGHPGPGDCSHYQNLQTSQGFKSLHRGGANFVMADGSTQFISDKIDYLTFQRLGDRRDGQPIEGAWNK